MRISHFFIDRPIFASVVSIVIVILGGVAFTRLPIAQYPEISPPTITVTGQYPGASADVVAQTVVTPIEQQINGVENMIYLSSNSTGDGRFTISVTFDLGTNLDIAQVQVQNRVAIAQPRLPLDVRAIGVTVQKSSPDLMMVVHLVSPDKSRDTLFISNYATINITDALTRVDGVGSIIVFGSRDYAMRIWLDPDRLQSVGLTASDVVIRAAGTERAGGVRRARPAADGAPGRVPDLGQHAGTPLRSDRIRQHRRQANGNCGRANEGCGHRRSRGAGLLDNSYLDRDPAVAIGIFQRPGSNALTTAKSIVRTMDELAKRFPARPEIHRSSTIRPSSSSSRSTRSNRRSARRSSSSFLSSSCSCRPGAPPVIPIIAIPVALIGTFFAMSHVRIYAQ